MVKRRKTKAKPHPQSFFGLATVDDLNRLSDLMNAQINTVKTHGNITGHAVASLTIIIEGLQAQFKKNDLLERVQKLEAQVFPPTPVKVPPTKK